MLLHYSSEPALAAMLPRVQLPSSCSARMDSLLGLESNGFSLVAKACRSGLGLWGTLVVDDSSYWNSNRRIVHSILDKKQLDNPTLACLVCSTLDYLSVCPFVESLKGWLCLLGNSRPCLPRQLASLNAKVVMEASSVPKCITLPNVSSLIGMAENGRCSPQRGSSPMIVF